MRAWLWQAWTALAGETGRSHPLVDLVVKLVMATFVMFWALTILGVAVFALPDQGADPIYSWIAVFVGFVAPAVLLWLLFRSTGRQSGEPGAERIVLELLRPGAPLSPVDVALRSTLTVDEAKATLERLAADGQIRVEERDERPAYYLWKPDYATDGATPGTANEQPPIELAEPLSEREREVLIRLAQGRSNKEIAAELVIAVGTVKTHVNNIYRKLGAKNRVEALARAKDAGVL